MIVVSGAAISLHWKMLSAIAGVTWWNFYFRLFPGGHSQPADYRVSLAPAASHSWQAADRLGWFAWPSQPRGVGLCATAARTLVAGVSSRLRAGTEPGGVSMVTLETVRVAQLLSYHLWAAKPPCAPSIAPDAWTSNSGHRLLAAGQPVFIVTILCNAQ